MEGMQWTPGIGDPSFVGWLTVIAYVAAAALCAWRYARDRGRVEGASLWVGLAGLLGLLAVNKQLDLQTLFTDLGRVAAREQGWYAQRDHVQLAFIVGALILGGIAVAVLARLARGRLRHYVVALFGAALVVCFVVVRATSFHGLDWLLDHRVAGLRLNWILELGAIAVVAWGALRPGDPRDEATEVAAPDDPERRRRRAREVTVTRPR